MESPAEIRKLDENVINRIAAGEVIQRPANALKEMIENSLDAKSTNIQITVKKGGLKLLQIQDNGTGIRKDDLEIVCERFTTSKLREFEDLNSISTYGFRGEALASISHVAHLSITSKTADQKCAYVASYEDGVMKGAAKPTAGNQGTQITVEDLFYNMYVRKKALRSAPEEYQKISDVVGKYAIHNADVGFGLKKHGDNNDIRTPPNSTHIDNIRTIYGNLIARELIEVCLDDDALKFNVHGYMTNVNYSTKKFTFLLFINHRLVGCQGLKKCIDQVYTTYLPKNMHPFVYLSVELDPKNVDVNVHPTKHEVHFFNEDQIIESITSSIEKKLLGSNNSRVFYMQAKLPNSNEMKNTDKKMTVYDKDLVRTDCNEQKLTKFFGAPTTSNDSLNESKFDGEFVKANRDFLEKNEKFEDLLVDQVREDELVRDKPAGVVNPIDETVSENDVVKCDARNTEVVDSKLNASLISRITRAETKLTSILELRKDIENNGHKSLRDLFSQHVFVGSINPKQSLLQHGTKLFLCNTRKIIQELFYQVIMYNFQNFGTIQLSEPLPIYKLALMALNLPEVGWTPEDGDKTELAQKATEILTEKGEMLNEYFSMEIDEYGYLKTLPILLENYLPEMTGLPVYVLRLATEVDWESERRCFETFALETSIFYSEMTEKSENWKWVSEHVVYPAVKEYFLPPKKFTENAAVLQIADLPNLYKVFERC